MVAAESIQFHWSSIICCVLSVHMCVCINIEPSLCRDLGLHTTQGSDAGSTSDMAVAALYYSAILLQANLQLVLKPGF